MRRRRGAGDASQGVTRPLWSRNAPAGSAGGCGAAAPAGVGAATISAARTAAAASALVMAAVARRQVLLVMLLVLSVGTAVGEVGATLVSSPVRVGFPAVRTQRAPRFGRKRIGPFVFTAGACPLDTDGNTVAVAIGPQQSS